MRLDQIRGNWAAWTELSRLSPWWQAATWIPVGYAGTRLYGGAPLVLVGCIAALVAGLHRLMPGVVEVGLGGIALLVGLIGATDGDCRDLLGGSGVATLLVFGGVMYMSAAVRLLGSANLREMSRHLLAAAGALVLGTWVVSPLTAGPGMAALLLAVLGAATFVGARRDIGQPLLGFALVAAELVMAVTDAPCKSTPVRSLFGMAVFSGAATYFWSNAPPPDYDEDSNVDAGSSDDDYDWLRTDDASEPEPESDSDEDDDASDEDE